jgi:hypothetical protein
VEQPFGEHSLGDGLFDAAAVAYAVDGAEVVFMASLDGLTLTEIDAERSVEKGRFDVVDCDGVPAENDVDPPARNEFRASGRRAWSSACAMAMTSP